MNAKKRLTIFECFARQNSHPKTELHYCSPFELLIAVMLSAQTTDRAVNKVTASLFSVANTPQAIVNLCVTGLETYIRSIGLYRTKANNIIKTCQLLLDNHQGHVPNQRIALESLPGVGRKTANVILNTVFDQPTIAVDTHVFRVCNRTCLAVGKTPRAVEARLMKVVSAPYIRQVHHWLVLHGRYVCTSRKPRCISCIISQFCEYPDKQV